MKNCEIAAGPELIKQCLNCVLKPNIYSCGHFWFHIFVCFIVRQDPLLGGSEMFNGFLRKAQQVGNAVSFRLDMH